LGEAIYMVIKVISNIEGGERGRQSVHRLRTTRAQSEEGERRGKGDNGMVKHGTKAEVSE
jgi:hypothetical protein